MVLESCMVTSKARNKSGVARVALIVKRRVEQKSAESESFHGCSAPEKRKTTPLNFFLKLIVLVFSTVAQCQLGAAFQDTENLQCALRAVATVVSTDYMESVQV